MISKESFTEWVYSKEDNDIVGYSKECANCPIARFFKETEGMRYASVCEGTLEYRRGIHTKRYSKKLPLWAKKLEREIDITTSLLTLKPDVVYARKLKGLLSRV